MTRAKSFSFSDLSFAYFYLPSTYSTYFPSRLTDEYHFPFDLARAIQISIFEHRSNFNAILLVNLGSRLGFRQ